MSKNHDKKENTHTTRRVTHSVPKKARSDRYYEDFDTIKIPQHKHTFIHTIVREIGTLEMNKSPADGGLCESVNSKWYLIINLKWYFQIYPKFTSLNHCEKCNHDFTSTLDRLPLRII